MKAVSRGARTPLLLGDMPFGSFLDPDQAVLNAARIVKEGGMDAVKTRGRRGGHGCCGSHRSRGIPVMGHIGLTPQTSGAHGGYRVQGKKAEAGLRLIQDAQALENAGAFGVVLELVPGEVAQQVSDHVSIPTIGIGSGVTCAGQVLVWHDLLGLSSAYGRHVRQYADLHAVTLGAIGEYAADVRAGRFPSEEQTWHMSDQELQNFVGVES